jgi:hypothetical protein
MENTSPPNRPKNNAGAENFAIWIVSVMAGFLFGGPIGGAIWFVIMLVVALVVGIYKLLEKLLP